MKRPCKEHARGELMAVVTDPMVFGAVCPNCGLVVPLNTIVDVGWFKAIIRADRDFYIKELES